MVFTVEPILTMFEPKRMKVWKDQWTYQLPFNPSAQWEHMVRVTPSGPEILTELANEEDGWDRERLN